MLLRIHLCLLLLLFSIHTFAQQEPVIEWQKCLGGSSWDRAHSVKPTSDGGYIVAGYTESTDGDATGNQGNDDFWVVKLDAAGNLVWQKTIGGSGDEQAYCIQQTSDGGYIVAGYSNSNDGDVSGNHGSTDVWVVKLDGTGSLIWQKALGGSLIDAAYSIQQVPGGYILAGYTWSSDGDVSGFHGAWDFWVVRLSSSGFLIWQKALGGQSEDEAHSIQRTSDGGYIVAGRTVSNDGDVSGNHGNWDYWVVKLNSSGNLIWQKALGGSSTDRAYAVRQTSDGGYIVAGESFSNDGDVSGNHGDFDQWIVKLDGLGNLVWQRSLGGGAIDRAYAVQQTSDGGYIVLGESSSNNGDISGNHGSYDLWMVKLDNLGNLTWQKAMGGSNTDSGRSLEETSDGELIVAGYTSSNNWDVNGNHGINDQWVVKLNEEFCSLSSRVNLGGAFDTGTGLMRDDLRIAQLIPLNEPYGALTYLPTGGQPASVLHSSLLAVAGTDAIADWLIVELRSSTNNAQVVASRYAVLQRDGDIVDLDGNSPVTIVAPADNYYIAIRHRNHLGILSENSYALSPTTTSVDFTSTQTPTYGVDARQNINGTMVMWSANTNFDQQLAYVGSGNDRDQVLVRVGGSTPTATVSGYYQEDVNMDGTVKYVGANNDRDPILVNIGGNVPTGTRVEQLP